MTKEPGHDETISHGPATTRLSQASIVRHERWHVVEMGAYWAASGKLAMFADTYLICFILVGTSGSSHGVLDVSSP